MNCLWNSWRERSSSSAPSANTGLRRTKAATIWDANAEKIFAISVEEYMESVSVYRSSKKQWEEDRKRSDK
jgi:hypothetical protein